VSKSTDVEEETFKGSFLTLGAASRGSGRCRPRGITHTQSDQSISLAELLEELTLLSFRNLLAGFSG